MRLRVSGAVVLAALVVVAAGCGGDPEPILAPTPSASSTTSASPSPTESEVAEETPEEFVERWVAAYNAMQLDGDVSRYLALSPDCEQCRGVAEQVRDIYTDGGRIETQGWSILRFLDSSVDGHDGTVDARIKSAPTSIWKGKGQPKQVLAGGVIVERFFLVHAADGWTLRQTAQVAQ